GKQDARTPGKRVWELVPQEAQAIALDKNQVHQINVFARRQLEGGATERGAITAMNKLRRGLEEVLRRPDFYQEKAFAKVTLDAGGKQLQQRHKDLSMLEMWVFNRRLLEGSFPEMVKRNVFSLEKATVPVRVVATKEPITLVLCSYESVRWLIQPEKGANI